jgi:hypothetical protein
MYLEDAKRNSYLRRNSVFGLGDYMVRISSDGTTCYFDRYTKLVKNKVAEDSNIWSHDDFVYVNKQGNLLPNKNKKEKEMSKNVNYIGGEYKVVMVSYELVTEMVINEYAFKADIDLKVNEGDLVVVDSTTGLGIAKVTQVLENSIDNANQVKAAKAWVVDVIDTSAQDKRKEATRQREYILQQLKEKKAQMEAVSVYALLAKTDPEAEKLLNQLESLGK